MRIKYQNLHSFKEGLVLLGQSILETTRITYLHGSAQGNPVFLEMKETGSVLSLEYMHVWENLKLQQTKADGTDEPSESFEV